MTIRTKFPDGGYHTRFDNGIEYWRDSDDEYHRDDGPAYSNGCYKEYRRHGKLHRLDGPAITHHDGGIEYWVNGEIPTHILDIVIIREEMDFDMFPSSLPISNYYDNDGRKAYRVADPDEFVLAILRYS